MRFAPFAPLALCCALVAGPLLGGCRTARGRDDAAGAVAGAALDMNGKEPRVATELPNGVRVVIEENHVAPVVAVQVWVASGAADDPPELAGAAHLYEHLLLRGGKRHPSGGAGRDIAAVEGTLGAWTGFDETVFHASVAAPFFDLALDVLADAVGAPGFDPAEVERARKVALDEIAGVRADPGRAASEALFAAAFPGHGYGRPVLGTAASVAGLTRDGLAARHATRYVGPAITVVVVGDVGSGAREAVARAFGGLPRGQGAPAGGRGASAAAPSARAVVAASSAGPPEIVVGFRTAELGPREAAALDLVGAVLAGGGEGRLGREVVRNRQLVQGVRPFTFHSRGGGLVGFAMTPAPRRIAEAGQAAVDVALRLAAGPIGADELARARAALLGDLARGAEGPLGRARRLGFATAVAGDAEWDARYGAELRELGPAELQAEAAKLLDPKALVVAVAVPEGAPAGRDEAPVALRARLEQMVAVAAPAVREAPAAVAGGDVVRVVAPSGARLLVLRDRTAPLVSIEAAWTGAGIDADDGTASAESTLIAALLDRGTRTRSAAEVASEMRSMGGALEGFARPGAVGLRAELLPSDLERGLALLADCLLHPAFPSDDLDTERRSLADRTRAAAQGSDAGGRAALRLFRETIGSAPERRPESESVGRITRVRLLDHYRREHAPARLIVAVVGAVEPAMVVATLSTALGAQPAVAAPRRAAAAVASTAMPATAAAVAPAGATVSAAFAVPPVPATGSPPAAPAAASQEGTTVFRGGTAGSGTDAVVGYPTFAPGDPDRLPIELLVEILGGEGGRLGAALRDDRTLGCRARARAPGPAAPGYLAVALSCAPARLDAAVAAVRGMLASLGSSGVTPDEVTRAARHLIGARAAMLRTRAAIADALVRDEGDGFPMLSYRGYAAAMARPGAADVARAARRMLDPKREVIAVVGR